MDIIEKFLNKPKLSTFIKLCKYIFENEDYVYYYGNAATTHTAAILSKFPDLLWLTSYNIGLIKHSISQSFNSGYKERIWETFHYVFEKLHDKQLIID